MALYVDVILPLQLAKPFTYAVPAELEPEVEIGRRVVVSLRNSKLYAALIADIHRTAPVGYEAKFIDSIIDEKPVVNSFQFRLWHWMAEYYMCTIGEVMNAALPGGMKLSSETAYVLNTEKEVKHELLNDYEYMVYEALEIKHVLKEDNIRAILNGKRVHSTIKNLIDKQVILIQEEIKHKFKPKKETYVRLTDFADNEENLKIIFDKLGRAEKQLNMLMAYVNLSKRYSAKHEEVRKAELERVSSATSAILTQLVKKNVFEIYEKEVGRFASGTDDDTGVINLSEKQNTVLDKIRTDFKTHEVALLHGVTSSGKTEMYFKLIEEVLEKGKQVLYLMPEISLTAQMINRLRKHFGNRVGIYHSKFNENERVEVWNNVLAQKQFDVVLGARSAVFLPFSNLGLIIVDEEHDPSFKQQDPAPRYNGRDAAIYLGRLHKTNVLLGSATPSLESFYNAKNNKYGFAQILARYGKSQMPGIVIVDVKEETQRKKMKEHFTSVLMTEMENALKNKQQIILFQNRRGYVPMHQCNHCGHIPMCVHCDVSLTYHKTQNILKCHYCGYSEVPHKTCVKCGSTDIRMKGFGTEKIEDDIKLFFPDAKVSRMDWDTTRSRHAFTSLIHEFEQGNIDILVGTQMVTKGLDFENVTVVGILNADSALNYPDFRAFERSYQLMSQVSGRAGRKDKPGKVIIQTLQPQHEVLKHVVDSDYEALYKVESEEREKFKYPPYYRIIEILLKHKSSDVLNESADALDDELRRNFGNRVLGPEYPLISRIKNVYQKRFLLKMERGADIHKAKTLLYMTLTDFKVNYKQIQVVVDVDVV